MRKYGPLRLTKSLWGPRNHCLVRFGCLAMHLASAVVPMLHEHCVALVQDVQVSQAFKASVGSSVGEYLGKFLDFG